MVTHTQALRSAMVKYLSTYGHEAGLEAAIRAYLDARGLVMVPKEPTVAMKEAADSDNAFFGHVATNKYRAMLDAAPDPFQEASE